MREVLKDNDFNILYFKEVENMEELKNFLLFYFVVVKFFNGFFS